MDNIYFSEYLYFSSEEEYKYFDELVNAVKNNNNSIDSLKNYLEDKYNVIIFNDDIENYPGFLYEYKLEKNKVFAVLLYCNEKFKFNRDNLVSIMSSFLKKFRPNGYFALEYVTTCSKPIPKKFYGTSIFLTATTMDVFETRDWINSKIWNLNKG